jgi:hypothetical protein
VKGRRSRPRRQLNSRYIPVQICTGCAKLGALLFAPAFVALNFAHRSFDACEIFALAAAEITRVFPPVVLALLMPPKPGRFGRNDGYFLALLYGTAEAVP